MFATLITAALLQASPAQDPAPNDDARDRAVARVEAAIAALDPPSIDELLRQLGPRSGVEEILAFQGRGGEDTAEEMEKRSQALSDLRTDIITARAHEDFETARALAVEQIVFLERQDRWIWAAEPRSEVETLDRLAGMSAADRAAFAATDQMVQRARELQDEHRDMEAAALVVEQFLERDRLIPGGVDAVHSLSKVAYLLRRDGRPDLAEVAAREAIARMLDGTSPSAAHTAIELSNLGALFTEQGDYERGSLFLGAAALELLRGYGPDHPSVWSVLVALARNESRLNRHADARRLALMALEHGHALRTKRSGKTAIRLRVLTGVFRAAGDLEEAARLQREALAIFREVTGESSEQVARTLSSLGATLVDLGRLSDAENTLRAAYELHRRHAGPGVLSTLRTRFSLGVALHLRGDLRGARALYGEVLSGARLLQGRFADELVADVSSALGGLLVELGELGAGCPLLEEALAIQRRMPGQEAEAANTLAWLARAASAVGDREAALVTWREAVAAFEAAGRAHTPHAVNAHYHVALESQRTDRPEEALRLCEEGLARGATEEEEHVVSRARLLQLRAALRHARGEREAALEDLFSALELLEGRRLAVPAGGVERALFSRRLQHAESVGTLASLLVDEGRPGAALGVAERGKARALLELLDVAGEPASREAAGSALSPIDAEAACAMLREGELLLVYAWSSERVSVVAATHEGVGAVRGAVVAHSAREVTELEGRVEALRRDMGSRSGWSEASAERARELAALLFPTELRERVAKASSLLVIPDGPLRGFPLEPVAWSVGTTEAASPPLPISYAPSVTILADARRRASERQRREEASTPTAVVLGNPVFPTEAEPLDVPSVGVVLDAVPPGGSFEEAGLAAGDVVTGWAGEAVSSRADLERLHADSVAAGTRSVELRYWRDGAARAASLRVDAIDASMAPGEPRDALALLAVRMPALLERTDARRGAGLDTLGKDLLRSLPGTRAEALRVHQLLGDAGLDSRLLLAEDATPTALAESVRGARFVHLATHGQMGSDERPYSACVVLSDEDRPERDLGVLDLAELLDDWGGRLAACELATLSACVTRGGVPVGDAFVALPWGLFHAGATSMVVSSWNVHDRATALLMSRFYENLLVSDRDPPSKSAALAEAKAWLRDLPRKEQRERVKDLGLTRGEPDTPGEANDRPRQVGGAPLRPYASPYYWAGFVLVGEPD